MGETMQVQAPEPEAVVQPIGAQQVADAMQTLQRYKAGKANLEQRIIDNEQWYKMRHWECMRKKADNQVQPVSGWLFNAIANKHADVMDNYPAPNILPREATDRGQAQMLTSILPVILDQCDFEATYSDVADSKLRSGTGIYGVFWDPGKLGGLGDIAIRKIDPIKIYWEPGITDIQQSRNVFCVELVDNEALEEEYPQLHGKLGGAVLDVARYVYDDSVDTSNKSVVVDWYYKRRSANRTVLHYCKFVADQVLFATENDGQYADGWYAHGLYPFVFDPLFRVEGTPCGFGYIDVGKSAQEYIDRGNQAILQNMLANSRPRYFISNGGAVNEQEFADNSKDFVHVDGMLGQDSVRPIQAAGLGSIYVDVLNGKIDELKETTGNRDISTGGTSSGVTAASAIAAMQEAGSKLSRDSSKASYRAFRQIVLMVIELIRQYYDLPRCFRIVGPGGQAQFVQYSNEGLAPQAQEGIFGVDAGYRTPLFDVEITAQKQSPYSKLSQNEMALQFYSAGFFNPQMAEQALACLDMMDFDRKDMVIQKIQQNAMAYQQLVMLGGGAPTAAPGGTAMPAEGESGTESSVTSNARARVAEATAPW